MTKITVPSIRINKAGGKVKAFFNVNLGPIEFDDLRLIDGSNGLFVGFPSRKFTNKEGEEKYVDTIRLSRNADGKFTEIAAKLYDEILNAAMAEYEKVAGKLTPAAVDEDDEDLPF